VAVSFARIHWQNLANFGVLALEFTNAADHGRIQQGDVLLLTGVRDALVTGTEILVHNESRDEVYPVRHGLSARQVQMLLPGGLIPWLRDRRAQDAQMNSNQSLL
jgi:aconitate hydratase